MGIARRDFLKTSAAGGLAAALPASPALASFAPLTDPGFAAPIPAPGG